MFPFLPPVALQSQHCIRGKNSARIWRLRRRKTCNPSAFQETIVVHSPWGQAEVSMGVSCLHTIPPLRLPPSAPPSHFYDRECQVGCQGNRIFFFSMRCWNTWGGQGGFVSPCDEGSTLCMFNRQTYGQGANSPAHLAQPDYVQWSFWHLRLAGFIMRCSSHSGHLCYCSWWAQLRPQLVRSNKEDARVPHREHNHCAYVDALCRAQYFFVFFASQHPPTTVCLSTTPPPKKICRLP